MSGPDPLLARWQDGELSAAELARLKALLGDAAQRSALVREAHDRAAIIETLRAEDAAAQAPPGPATARLRVVGRTIDAQDGGPGAILPRHLRGAPRRRAPGVKAAQIGTAVVAAVLVVAVVLVLATWDHQPTRPAQAALAVVIGGDGARVVRAPGGAQVVEACSPGMAVHAGDRLDTTSGALRLRFADEETELDLAPGSRLILREAPGRREVRLETGAVAATVAKQSAGRALVFVTTQAEAWVVGTRLALKTGSGATRLEVSEGRVRFQARAGGTPWRSPPLVRRSPRPAGCAATTSRRWPPVCCPPAAACGAPRCAPRRARPRRSPTWKPQAAAAWR